jgi:hypothetical protein
MQVAVAGLAQQTLHNQQLGQVDLELVVTAELVLLAAQDFLELMEQVVAVEEAPEQIQAVMADMV